MRPLAAIALLAGAFSISNDAPIERVGDAVGETAGEAASEAAVEAAGRGFGRRDALEELARWTAGCEQGKEPEQPLGQVQAWIEQARSIAATDPGRGRELDQRLLEIAALEGGGATVSQAREIGRRRIAERAAARGADDSLSDTLHWLAREVVASPTSQSPARRRVAIDLVGDQPGEEITLALLTAARSAGDLQRELAVRELVGRADGAADHFFVDALEPRPLAAEALLIETALAHLRARRPLAQPELARRLQSLAATALVSGDWREASTGRELAASLPVEQAVPLLIEALIAWKRRTEDGRGGLRMEHEIARELERFSGRKLGTRPESWRGWWKSWQAGNAKSPAEAAVEDERRTRVEFFGVRLLSDRVVFVIDRSGSMSNGFGVHGRSRMEAAADQLDECLAAAGDGLRFTVVLFNDGVKVWKPNLVKSTRESRANVASWVRYHPADGGTWLRGGLEAALPVHQNRTLDLERLEADTVVVLCDGETDGPQWVGPWLRKFNARARLVFHCIELSGGGLRGAGALEALAAETGGEFTRISTD